MLRQINSLLKKYSTEVIIVGALIYMLYFLLHAAGRGCYKGVCGLMFVSTYFHDFVYHVSIVTSAFRTFPFRMPIFAGAPLQGYHYLYDLCLGILFWAGIPAVMAYWYVGPVVYFLIFFFVIDKFSDRFLPGKVFKNWLFFLYFFSGTFSYFSTLIYRKSLFGYGVSSLLHTSTIFLYPTVAFSMILFFLIWKNVLNRIKSNKSALFIGILLFLLFGTKFYGGLTMLVILITFEILNSWRVIRKFIFWPLIIRFSIYAVCSLAALVVFYNFPFSISKEPVFAWAPFATVDQIIEDEHAYRMNNLVLARNTLYTMGKFSPRLLAIETFSILLFIFHHFGIRIIGLIYLAFLLVRKKASMADWAFAVGVIFSFFMGVMYVQRGWHWWNVLQFHYYTAIILTVYTAKFFYGVMSGKQLPRYLYVLIIVGVLALSIPNAIEKMIEFGVTERYVLADEEIQALDKLRALPEGLVFTVPATPETAYISAFSGKQLYYADEEMLMNDGLRYESRKQALVHPESFDLNSIGAQYIYLVKTDPYYDLFLNKAKGTSYKIYFENKKIILMSR